MSRIGAVAFADALAVSSSAIDQSSAGAAATTAPGRCICFGWCSSHQVGAFLAGLPHRADDVAHGWAWQTYADDVPHGWGWAAYARAVYRSEVRADALDVSSSFGYFAFPRSVTSTRGAGVTDGGFFDRESSLPTPNHRSSRCHCVHKPWLAARRNR